LKLRTPSYANPTKIQGKRQKLSQLPLTEIERRIAQTEAAIAKCDQKIGTLESPQQ